MSVEDWEINTLVRSALVRRWVDIRKIQISTTQGIVHLKGSIEFGSIKTVKEYQHQMMGHIEKDIKATRGVRGVKMDLFNWEKNSITGKWEKKERKGT